MLLNELNSIEFINNIKTVGCISDPQKYEQLQKCYYIFFCLFILKNCTKNSKESPAGLEFSKQ